MDRLMKQNLTGQTNLDWDLAGKQFLTIEEVADMLKVSKMTLYRWNLNDTLPKIEIGGKRRYRRADVEAIIEQRKEKKQWTKK